MTLPEFNEEGDLPSGVHDAAWDEVLKRFGGGEGKRAACTRRLRHVYEIVRRTGYLRRFVIFGSYVTAKAEPNDVDVVLIMDDSFLFGDCPLELRGLFDHAVAQARYGASIFWMRPGMLAGETVDEFIAYWQIKRDGGKRGIVEIII